MIFKLNYKKQTHLYNSNLSIQNLKDFTKRAFKDLPDNYSFAYQSLEGQITYIQTDEDLMGLKYCCTSANSFIIKLTILRASKVRLDESLEQVSTINLVKENMSGIYQKTIIALDNQHKKEAICKYLTQTYEKVAKNYVHQQNLLISQEVGKYLDQMYQSSSQKLLKQIKEIPEKPNRRKIERYSPQKLAVFHSQKSLDQIVSERVLQLVPSIVDKIYSKMEEKLNNKCLGCLKREKQLENIIEREINRKLSINCGQENPEE